MNIEKINAITSSMINNIKNNIELFTTEDCEQYADTTLIKYLSNDIDNLEFGATLRQLNIKIMDSIRDITIDIDMNDMMRVNAFFNKNEVILERVAASKINLSRFAEVAA